MFQEVLRLNARLRAPCGSMSGAAIGNGAHDGEGSASGSMEICKFQRLRTGDQKASNPACAGGPLGLHAWREESPRFGARAMLSAGVDTP
jgi:hypothetical protein